MSTAKKEPAQVATWDRLRDSSKSIVPPRTQRAKLLVLAWPDGWIEAFGDPELVDARIVVVPQTPAGAAGELAVESFVENSIDIPLVYRRLFWPAWRRAGLMCQAVEPAHLVAAEQQRAALRRLEKLLAPLRATIEPATAPPAKESRRATWIV